jgi:hypothetical protein
MRKVFLAIAAAGIGFGSGPVATAQEAPSSDAEVQNTVEYLKVFVSALQSENVDQPIKGALVGCIYENPFSKIAEGIDKVIADNPGKIDRSKPDQILGVMARICGYVPPAAAAGNVGQQDAPPGR